MKLTKDNSEIHHMANVISEFLNWNYNDQKLVLELLGLNDLVALSTLPNMDKRKMDYDERSWDEWLKTPPPWLHDQ